MLGSFGLVDVHSLVIGRIIPRSPPLHCHFFTWLVGVTTPQEFNTSGIGRMTLIYIYIYMYVYL